MDEEEITRAIQLTRPVSAATIRGQRRSEVRSFIRTQELVSAIEEYNRSGGSFIDLCKGLKTVCLRLLRNSARRVYNNRQRDDQNIEPVNDQIVKLSR